MTVTRASLRQALQEAGLTYREARSVVKAIFETLAEELKRGEPLELPFGTLTFVKPEPKRAYRFGKIVKTHTKPKVHFRKP